jgi:P-type conjugative transfer protein TrbJ
MRKVISRISGWAALVVLPATLLVAPIEEARAQWVVSDPGTEINTMLTHVTQLLQYIKDVQTALATLQQATMMAREVQQLVTHPSTNILQDLTTISGVIQASQGLALDLARTDTTFRIQFAAYSPSPLTNYAAAYTNWSKTALNAIHAAANGAGYQGNMMGNEQQFMTQMQQLIQQPNGTDQSLQIGNAVGLETVAQLQKLRVLFIQNIGQQAAFTTSQLNSQQQAQTAQGSVFTYQPVSFDPKSW